MNYHWKENSERNTICHRKKPPVTRRNLISQEETSCHMKKHLKIDIQMAEDNAEEEMEIGENVPLLQKAYKIFKNAMNNHWKENNEWTLAL